VSRRKRKHIPMIEIAAAFAIDKLALRNAKCAEVAQLMREARISARSVLNQFTADHLDLHALGGADKWWNLDMKPRGPALFAKDRQDTSRVAKVRRINQLWGPFMAAMAKGRKPPKRISRWPKRKMRA
jgi:hypothetical protein